MHRSSNIVKKKYLILLSILILIYLGCDGDNSTDPVLPIPTQGLLAYYSFTNNANDSSGNDNHGVPLGGATITNVLTIGNNNVDRLSLPSTIVNGMTDFAFSARLKINTVHVDTTSGGHASSNTWISCARAGQGNALYIDYEEIINSWALGINTGRASDDHFNNSLITDKIWHHVVVMREGKTARCYIDGLEIGNGVQVNSSALSVDPGGFIIGQDQDSVDGDYETRQSWAGEIDNLRIYNRALSKGEIGALFNEQGFGN